MIRAQDIDNTVIPDGPWHVRPYHAKWGADGYSIEAQHCTVINLGADGESPEECQHYLQLAVTRLAVLIATRAEALRDA